MIPTKGWKSMDSAPRDGSIIMVKYFAYNSPSEALMIAAAQWLPSSKGGAWRWCHPWTPDRVQFADAWMALEELLAACKAEPPPERFQKTPVQDFDL